MLFGAAGNDTLNGGDDGDVLVGGADDDYLHGDSNGDGDLTMDNADGSFGSGEDTLWGGEGNDTLVGGPDDDLLYADEDDGRVDGGLGIDTVSYAGQEDGVTVQLNADTQPAVGIQNVQGVENFIGSEDDDVVTVVTVNDALGAMIEGRGGKDTLTGGDNDATIKGGDDDDTIVGGEGGDKLYGDKGDDSIMGGMGADTLTGGAGKDTLAGGAGADRIDGGDDDEEDMLSGDGDADVFVWRDGDTITDFKPGADGDGDGDRIDLTDLVSVRRSDVKITHDGTGVDDDDGGMVTVTIDGKKMMLTVADDANPVDLATELTASLATDSTDFFFFG